MSCSKQNKYGQPLYPIEDFYENEEDLIDLKNLRIKNCRERAIRYDNQLLIDSLPFIKNNNYSSEVDGSVINTSKYNRNLLSHYDGDNPFLNQGEQVIISTKALRELIDKK